MRHYLYSLNELFTKYNDYIIALCPINYRVDIYNSRTFKRILALSLPRVLELKRSDIIFGFSSIKMQGKSILIRTDFHAKKSLIALSLFTRRPILSPTSHPRAIVTDMETSMINLIQREFLLAPSGEEIYLVGSTVPSFNEATQTPSAPTPFFSVLTATSETSTTRIASPCQHPLSLTVSSLVPSSSPLLLLLLSGGLYVLNAADAVVCVQSHNVGLSLRSAVWLEGSHSFLLATAFSLINLNLSTKLSN